MTFSNKIQKTSRCRDLLVIVLYILVSILKTRIIFLEQGSVLSLIEFVIPWSATNVQNGDGCWDVYG